MAGGGATVGGVADVALKSRGDGGGNCWGGGHW